MTTLSSSSLPPPLRPDALTSAGGRPLPAAASLAASQLPDLGQLAQGSVHASLRSGPVTQDEVVQGFVAALAVEADESAA